MNILENKIISRIERISLCWKIDKFYKKIDLERFIPSLAIFGEVLKEIDEKNSYEAHVEFATILLPALDSGFANKRYWKLYNKLVFDSAALGSEAALCMKGGIYISGSNPLVKIDIEYGEKILTELINKQNIDHYIKSDAEHYLFRFGSDIHKEKQKKAEQRNIIETNNLTWWEWDQVDGKIDPLEIASSNPILNLILKKREKQIIIKNKIGKKDFVLPKFDSFFMIVSSFYTYLIILLWLVWEYVKAFQLLIYIGVIFFIFPLIGDYIDEYNQKYISSTYGHHSFVNIETNKLKYEDFVLDSAWGRSKYLSCDISRYSSFSRIEGESALDCLNRNLTCTKYQDYFENDYLEKDCSNYKIRDHYDSELDTNKDGVLDLSDYNYFESLKNRLENNINTFAFSFQALRLFHHDRSDEWKRDQTQKFNTTNSETFKAEYRNHKPYGILTRKEIASIVKENQKCKAIQFIYAYINNPEKENEVFYFLAGLSSKDFKKEWNKYRKSTLLEDDFLFLCTKYNSDPYFNLIENDFPGGSIKDLKNRFILGRES